MSSNRAIYKRISVIIHVCIKIKFSKQESRNESQNSVQILWIRFIII